MSTVLNSAPCLRELGNGARTLCRYATKRKRKVACASFFDSVTGAILGADTLAAVSGVGLSVLGLSLAAASVDDTKLANIAEPGDDDFFWSIATVASFVPYVNWMAWLLPAMYTDARQQSKFSAFTIIYALPLVMLGLGQEPGAWGSALAVLCVAHLQVELALNTNPEPAARLLKQAPELKALLVSSGTAVKQSASSFFEAFDYSVKTARDNASLLPTLEDKRKLELDLKSNVQVKELEQETWDSKLKKRFQAKDDT